MNYKEFDFYGVYSNATWIEGIHGNHGTQPCSDGTDEISL